MGMVTGIGGGMLRDLLAGRVPVVFSSELYATPALVGAAVAVGAGRRRPAAGAWSSSPGPACAWSWRLLAMCAATGGRRCRTGPANV